MLAGSISPRPRPPAKSRRTSRVKSSPPPPYRPSLPDEPLPSNVHGKHPTDSLRSDWPRLPFAPPSEEWNDRSREELSDLLHKADEIIKDRELELTMTSAVCKTLYENNLELKSRHQALLARLPHSPASSSPAGSSNPSPASTDSQLPQSPHYYSADEASPNASVQISRPRLRHRRVSVSPADLALLSDQNAELLAKLEKLEAESIQADQAGRRKLRSLEKEIQGLRDELEKTRAKSDELEQKARVFSESAVVREAEAERRRREREERLRALRNKAENGDQEGEMKDFAPGSALSGSKNKFAPRRRHISDAIVRPQRAEGLDERPRSVTLQPGHSRSVSLSHPPRYPQSTQPPGTLTHEYALVSQLLHKIQELEETNTQITEQQARTVVQLQTVQKDATSLRLAYESLGDAEGVEWITEESEGSPKTAEDEANETIRFASLRRTLSVDSETSVDFSGGIDVDMRSSLKPPILPDHVPLVFHSKVRRSVVGLFDSPRKEGTSPVPTVSETATPVLDMMIPGLPPVPFVPQPSNTSTSSPPRSPSPDLSPSLAGSVSPVLEDVLRRPTLDSELGAAFDGQWDGHLGQDGSLDDFHLRTSSIVTLSSVGPDGENAGNSVPVSASRTRAEPERSFPGFTPMAFVSGRSTALQPGAWQGDQHHGGPGKSDSQPGSPAEKQRRKSQTIRMRAAHWKEGRFGGTLIPTDKPGHLDISRPSTPVPERLASAFEAIVDTMNRSKAELTVSLDLQDEINGRSADTSAVGVRLKPPRQRGIVAFVLELWLWLQFAVIVIVFVWAMARRGPKSVLEEAGRRKGSLMG